MSNIDRFLENGSELRVLRTARYFECILEDTTLEGDV
jgi:hypothetical protein